MVQVKVSVDNNKFIKIYSGTPRQDVVWLNSSNAFQTLGNHNLKVNIVDEFDHSYNREYLIKVIPSSDALYKDNYGNTLRVWKGNNNNLVTPVVFSEGFDAFDTNPQEMYYYAAQDLIECMNQYGFDVFLLDNIFGTQDIRNNSAGFSSAVRYVFSLYDNIPIIAGGVSMGGMIARYAFAKEEGESNPLPASVFISVDSPQQGAVISKPLQDYKKEKQQGDGFAEHALNNDAAKQLLNYCSYDPSGEIHSNFYEELNALNGDGYPHNTQKNIGISFSTNQPNPNQGRWVNIKWHIGPFTGEEKSFDLTSEEMVAGSYLPVDLTTMDPTVMLATYWWGPLLLPIIPLHYPTITFERISDPTYIPYNSALDIVNNKSKFDVIIEPNKTTHHDILPSEIINPIVTELLLINKYIQNINLYNNHSIIGSSVLAGNHVTNDIPYGDVVIHDGASVSIIASESIVLKEGVKANEGALLSLAIDNNFNSTCEQKMFSIPRIFDIDPTFNEFIQGYSNANYKILSRNLKNGLSNNVDFSIYPNPCKNSFNIVFNYWEIKHIILIDIYGEIILNKRDIAKKSIRIDTSHYPPGMYFVFIKTDHSETIRKIVIQ